MKGLKTSGVRNIQKIDKEMGDGTATRKMMDNLGQVGAGLARVAGRTALGTAQSVAAVPGALKMAAKQRKDDVESGVTKKLGSRLGLRKPDAAERKRAQQDRLQKIRDKNSQERQEKIRARAQSIKYAGERKRERQETEKLNNRQKIRDRIEAARKDNAERRKNLQSLGKRQKGGALATRPVQKINTDQNVSTPITRTRALPPAKDTKALPAARSPKALPPTMSAAQTTAVSRSNALTTRSRELDAKKKEIGQKRQERAQKMVANMRASGEKTREDRVSALLKAAGSRSAAGKPEKRMVSIDKPDAQRARRDPEYRRKLMQQREEFIYEVENMKKEKVDKVIDIMRGKNKVEVNPKVNESHILVQDLADYKPLEIETIDLIKPEPLKASNWRNEISEEDKKIISINKGKRLDAKKQAFKDMVDEPYETDDKKRKEYGKKLLDRLTKVDEGAAWTKKEGKNKSGGLNEKGRKSYERENPGSDLKAPSKKVGNPRRKSFCARMKGMKKKLTSKKTASDPNSRINKSLRAWNC